jgi:hypothetical protein
MTEGKNRIMIFDHLVAAAGDAKVRRGRAPFAVLMTSSLEALLWATKREPR